MAVPVSGPPSERPALRAPLPPVPRAHQQRSARSQTEQEAVAKASKPQGESSSLGGREATDPQGSKTRLGAWTSCAIALHCAPPGFTDTRVDASGQHFFHDLAGVLGQPLLAAVVPVRQAQMVQAEQVQDRGMEIMDMDRLILGTQAHGV